MPSQAEVLGGVDVAALLTTFQKLNLFSDGINGADHVKDVSFSNCLFSFFLSQQAEQIIAVSYVISCMYITICMHFIFVYSQTLYYFTTMYTEKYETISKINSRRVFH